MYFPCVVKMTIIITFITILYVTTPSLGNGISAKEIIESQLDTEYSGDMRIPNKDDCKCSQNDTMLSCTCPSFQFALKHLENNTIIMINVSSTTLPSKVRLKNYHNISIIGYPFSTIQCNNAGCLQFEYCRNISIENVAFNKCSCKNATLPAGITIQNSAELNFKNYKFQYSSSTAVYLENVCGMVNFDSGSFWSNTKDALSSNVTSTAGLEINYFKDTCVSKDINSLKISINNSSFSNNQNIKCHNCSFAGALQIFVQTLNHLNVTISNTIFTDNEVRSGVNTLFNCEASAVRIWMYDVSNPFVSLANLQFASNKYLAASLDHVSVLTVSHAYSSNNEVQPIPDPYSTVMLTSSTFIYNTANVIAEFTGFTHITIMDCSFHSNEVMYSPHTLPHAIVFTQISKHNSARNYVHILKSNFTDNIGGSVIITNPDSTVYLSKEYVFTFILYQQLMIRNNTFSSRYYVPVALLSFRMFFYFVLSVTEVSIVSNRISGIGGGMYFGSLLDDGLTTSHVNITNLTFENNTVSRSHGAAMWMPPSSSVHHHCTITNSSFRNTVGGKSIIYCFSRNILLTGNCEFVRNSGTAIHITGKTLKINGNVTFDSNVSEDGGALHLDKSSTVSFTNFSRVTFTNNVATRYGGVIFADKTDCSKDSITDNSQEILFDSNTAIAAGNEIYYSLPNLCNHTFHNPGLNKSLLVTSPDKLVLETQLYNGTYIVEDVMLGQVVSISACLQDINGNPTGTALFRINVIDSNFIVNSGFAIVGCHESHGIINLQFFGNIQPTDYTATKLQLTSLFDNSFDWKPIIVDVLVNLTQCHLGFYFDAKQKKCVCQITENVVTCSRSSSTIKRGYWFGSVNNRSTVTLCPLNYCYFTDCQVDTGICSLYDQSLNGSQCWDHRYGVACSKCRNGYTLSYDSTECISDDRCTIGQTILVLLASSLYWVAAIVGIFVVMHFKILIGYFYGITFYYSMIDILLGQTSYSLQVSVIVISSVAKLTPQFLGKLCFVQGMSGIDQQFIHYVHSLAVLSILAAICIAARYSGKLTSLVSRGGVINVICFILLLSYTSITSTSLLLMRPLKFTGIDQVYTYLSPDIEYFHGRHAVYAAIAIVCELVIVIGLPLLLLLQPFLNHRINFIRIMPLLDQFQSCYKNKFRWFASYYMICRQIIIAIIISDVAGDFSSLYMLFTACLIMDLIHVAGRPYKSNKLNIFDGFVLHVILTIITLKIIDHSNGFSSQMTTGIAFVLVLLPFSVYAITVLLHTSPSQNLTRLLCKTACHSVNMNTGQSNLLAGEESTWQAPLEYSM